MNKLNIKNMVTVEIRNNKKNGDAVEKTVKVWGIIIYKKIIYPMVTEEGTKYWLAV
jgi:hypothetical protein